MDITLQEETNLPSGRFHLLFIIALLGCAAIVGLSVLYSPYQFCPSCVWNAHNIATQTIGVIAFTGITWIILRSRAKARTLHMNGTGPLAVLEKTILVEYPWLATFLIWATGIAFFFLMAREVEAAIFLMAVIAIYVAVEHLGGLHEQSDLMGQQRDLTERQRVLLEDYDKKLGSLANAAGLEHGRDELYKAYKISKDPIVAVVRSFDIDVQWFNAGRSPDDYKEILKPDTFYNSMMTPTEALFVSDLPLPLFKNGPHPPGENELADQFNNLLGLAWQWCMLEEITGLRRAKGVTCNFQIKIASTSNWIHVANNHVYQLIKARVPRESKVRDLTYDLDRDDDLRKSLLYWAVSEIKDAAENGCSGEEYLCATLFSLPHVYQIAETARLTRGSLELILEELGMGEWVARKADYVEGLFIENEKMPALCVAIFERFLVAVTANDRKAVTFSPGLNETLKAARTSPFKDEICSAIRIGREVM